MGVENVQAACLAKGIKHCGYHVCILGCIASGKSTWAKALEQVIIEKEGRCEGLWEPVETNPLLPLYYQDPKRYAFSMQVNMLNKRYEQQLLAQDLALAGVSSVQDSSMFGDSCFVEMLKDDGILCDEEVTVYSELFANMSRSVMYPSLVIYLDCPPETAKERVIKRGRECEKDISVYYLASLKLQIEKLIKEFYRYTFVKEINVSCDMTPDEIKSQAYMIYDELQMMRNKPILSRMGV
jgi:deoxyadenosine/deoxycytidine kinase